MEIVVTFPVLTFTIAMPGFGLSLPVFSLSANATFRTIATKRLFFEMTGEPPSATLIVRFVASSWTTPPPSPRSGCSP